MDGMPRYFLAGLQDENPLRFELTPDAKLVGRTPDCDFPVPDPAVSRRHAELRVKDDGAVFIKDLGSLNGTFINGSQLKGETVLTTGDKVRFGHVTLTLQEHEATPWTRLSSDDNASATLTTSIHEIKAEAARSRSSRILAAVSEAGTMLSRRMDRDDIYENVLDLLERFITASRILILNGSTADDPENSVLASRVHDTAPDEPLQMSRTMLHDIISEGKSFVTSDASTDSQWEARGSIVRLGVKAAMGAPLFDNDRILGAMYVDSRMPGVTYQSEDLQLLSLLANMLAVKMTNSRLEEEERALDALRQELAVARKIQENLLPGDIPRPDGYEVFAHQSPCEDIGGDLYDVRAMEDGRIWLVLGDVTGHGIGAALLMSNVMAGLQILEDHCKDPVSLVSQLESYLGQHIELGQFVTLFVGILDPATGRLEYVNAGHNPPFVLCRGDRKHLPATGVPVAILPGGQERGARECILEKGSTLLVFSDGVSEFTQGTTQYDEGRMQEYLASMADADARTLGEGLLEDVTEFGGGLPAADDLTLLILRRN